MKIGDKVVMNDKYYVSEENKDNTLEDFTKAWKEDEYEPESSFCLDSDKVEVIEVIRKEQRE